MDIHYPDWKTLTLRQFHMAGPRPGVLEGRLRVIHARAQETTGGRGGG